MARKGHRLRNATAIEVEARIRDAGDHIGGLITHEKGVADAAERNAAEDELEAHRRFDRDLSAFFAVARTARNYLIQMAQAGSRRDWIEAQLAPKLFEFHRAITNQVMHEHPVRVSKTYDVKGTAVVHVVRLLDGARPILIPQPSPLLKYTGMRLTYVEADLEPVTLVAYETIKSGSNGVRGAIQLAGDYIHGLREVVNKADREKVFELTPTLGPPSGPAS